MREVIRKRHNEDIPSRQVTVVTPDLNRLKGGCTVEPYSQTSTANAVSATFETVCSIGLTTFRTSLSKVVETGGLSEFNGRECLIYCRP